MFGKTRIKETTIEYNEYKEEMKWTIELFTNANSEESAWLVIRKINLFLSNKVITRHFKLSIQKNLGTPSCNTSIK